MALLVAIHHQFELCALMWWRVTMPVKRFKNTHAFSQRFEKDLSLSPKSVYYSPGSMYLWRNLGIISGSSKIEGRFRRFCTQGQLVPDSCFTAAHEQESCLETIRITAFENGLNTLPVLRLLEFIKFHQGSTWVQPFDLGNQDLEFLHGAWDGLGLPGSRLGAEQLNLELPKTCAQTQGWLLDRRLHCVSTPHCTKSQVSATPRFLEDPDSCAAPTFRHLRLWLWH